MSRADDVKRAREWLESTDFDDQDHFALADLIGAIRSEALEMSAALCKEVEDSFWKLSPGELPPCSSYAKAIRALAKESAK